MSTRYFSLLLFTAKNHCKKDCVCLVVNVSYLKTCREKDKFLDLFVFKVRSPRRDNTNVINLYSLCLRIPSRFLRSVDPILRIFFEE